MEELERVEPDDVVDVEAEDPFFWKNAAGGVIASLIAAEIVQAAQQNRPPSLASLAATAKYVSDELSYQMMMLRRPPSLREQRRAGVKG